MTLDEKMVIPFLAFVLVVVACYFLTPSTRWFDVNSFDVLDVQEGETGRAVYDRTIHREFQGRWLVSIWREDRPFCTGSADAFYRPQTLLDPVVTLEWLAGEDCGVPLPCGDYTVEAAWTINSESNWFWRRHARASDTFTVICEDGRR